MTSLRLFKTLSLTAGLMAGTSAIALPGPHITTSDFSDVAQTISDAVETYGANKVLLAFDIDNTTLETEKDLGSEHWFLWQSKMITDGNFGDGAVARNISELLDVQSMIVHLSKMTSVEPRITRDLAQFGQQGVKMLALTSRNIDVRDATEREMKRNEFPYARFAPGAIDGYAGTFKPYHLQHLDKYGLTEADVTKFGLKEASDVSYQKGIFLTAGQHKGVMLRTLLSKIHGHYDAVIFVDDRLKHSEGMRAAFESEPELVTTIQYTHTAEKVAKFEASDKKSTKADWCEFARGLKATQVETPVVPFIPCP